MKSNAQWGSLVAAGRVLLLLSIVAAALLSAPTAQATDGGSHGYLPEKNDWCLGVDTPELRDVGYLHALVRLEYWDDCLFPAKSSIEIRSGDGGWSKVESEYTKSSDRQSKKWTVRNIRLSDLHNNTRYFIRSRIDYGTGDAHTSELTFRTGGNPAKEMRAQGTLPASQVDASISLSAVIPDEGKITPRAIWVAPSGYEQYSDEQPWREQTPFASHLKRDCQTFTDNYSKCTWQFQWRVSIGVPRPVPPFMWKDGLQYRVRFCIANSVYSPAFGDQCTKEFTVQPGKAAQIDVGQAS
jgi:hypothetical protein